MSDHPVHSFVRIDREQDGTHTLKIEMRRLRIRRKAGTHKYVMAEVDAMLPIFVDIGGLKVRPKLVLTLHRKLNAKERQALRMQRKFPIPDYTPRLL